MSRGIYADRVKETTTTSGTGTVTLAGAASGYQAFSTAFPATVSRVRYLLIDGSNWEVGEGTYTLSGTTLSRDVVYDSSSGVGTAITLSGGTVSVFCDLPARDLASISLTYALAMNMVNQ